MEKMIETIKDEARRSWSGEIGEKRATEVEKYLRNKLKDYSDVTGLTQEEILKAWESHRNYSAINYYQECMQPSIKSGRVKVFNTTEEMMASIGDMKFRCPACEGISTNPYRCDSGIENKGKTCDWNVGGLFGDLGKGVFVYCKDKVIGETIFTPIAWEDDSLNR